MSTKIKPPRYQKPGMARQKKIVLNDNKLLLRALTYVLAEYGRRIIIPDEVMRGEVADSGLMHDHYRDRLTGRTGTWFQATRPRRLRHRILLFFRSIPVWLRARRAIKARRTSTRTDEGAVSSPGTSDLGGRVE